jgi:hypothetical protein
MSHPPSSLGLRILWLCLILLLLPALANAAPVLSLEPFDFGIRDGSEPFGEITKDATDGSFKITACDDAEDKQLAGADCGGDNGVVRTQDSVINVWSVTANGGDATIPEGAPIVSNVIFEQIITPSANAVVSFKEMPVVCLPIAGGGTNPPIRANLSH